ncbi:MAG TPA: YeeE/YedE thiosulfate transporter family protein [Anaeromyxobacteraceae bacterium]|nr:YeeE/YedE thiosulfate transporter family protein [Anaeromyxobacteraceae bacterium]
MERNPNRFWNPYVAGVALGLVLLSAYALTGKGLGASGASFRVGVTAVNAVAPDHVAAVPMLAAATEEGSPLSNWLVFEVAGVVLGGLLGAWTSGRLKLETLRGPTFGQAPRLALALLGGAVMGVGAGMARGCASGQGLSGGGLMSAGAWAFMLCFFAGGYAMAWFVRREYR